MKETKFRFCVFCVFTVLKELLVLCVQPDLSDALYAIDGGEGVAFAAMEAARKDGHEAAKKVLKKFAVLAGNHPCKFLLGHGDPAETICEEAKTRKVETIVVGRRALGSIQRWFTGSNSMKVSRKKTNCTLIS